MSDFVKTFEHPPKKFMPFVRWWWPGLAVEHQQLSKELDLLSEMGIGGVEIQPFLIGGSGSASSEECHRMAPHPYYYKTLLFLLEEARKRQMKVDMTFGSSWPPGSTEIGKKDNLKTLLAGVDVITGGQEINKKPPEIQLNAYYKYKKLMKMIMGGVQEDFEDFLPEFSLVALVAVKPEGSKTSDTFNYIFPKETPLDYKSAIDITDKYKKGKIKWTVPGTKKDKWYVFSFYGGPTGMTPMSDAKSKPGKRSLVVDILNSSSVNILLKSLLGVNSELFSQLKEYYGSTFRALFTDSQEIADEWFWTPEFFDNFKQLRGYDVKPYLPACFVPNRDNQFLEVFFQNTKSCFEYDTKEVGKRIRYDWLTTLSDIWSEQFIRHISDSGTEYGIKHRIQTYGMPVDLLKTFGASDIPETETLFSGSLDFFKLASSAGLLYNKKKISSETFSWMNQDLTLTPLKWKAIIDKLTVAGINQNVYHGWTYTKSHGKHNFSEKKNISKGNYNEEEKITRKLGQEEYPGHYPWAGHGFSNNLTDKSLFWPHYKQLNDYTSRLQLLMRGGEIQTNVAIFVQEWNYTYKHLTNELMEEGYLEEWDSGRIKGAIPWFMRRERSEIDKKNRIQQKIGRQLMNGGYWYIHVNCDALLKGEIKKNKFEIGNTKLEAIIFPYIEHIPIKLAEKLLEWSKKGLKLLFLGKLPHRTSGYLNFEKNDQKLQKIIKNLNSNEDSFFKISGKLKNLPYLTQYMTENMGVEPFLTGFVHDPYTTYIWRIYEQQDILFLRNSKNDFRSIKINFGNKLKDSIKQKKYKYELDPWSGGIYETKFGIESEIKNYETLQFAPFGTRTFVFSSKKLQISNSTNRLRPYKHLQTLSGAWQYLPIKDSWNLTIRHRKPDANLQDISLDLPKLKDWRDLREAKYCSGPGLYQNKFTLTNAQWESLKQADKRVLLDLGKVQDVAEISINKKVVGNYLIPPYRADITTYVKEGDNRLEITITGTLQNRLVGYGKQFKKAWGKYRKRRLVPVGLIGPVKIFIADFPRQKTK